MFESITFSSWIIATAVGGIAIVGGGVTYAMAHGKIPLPDFLKVSIDELVKTQIVDDEFDGTSLMTWIKKNRSSTKFKVLVVKPTKIYLKKFNLKDGENIDSEKNLIACMINDKGKYVNMQLFTFSSVSSKMQEKFNDNGELCITE